VRRVRLRRVFGSHKARRCGAALLAGAFGVAACGGSTDRLGEPAAPAAAFPAKADAAAGSVKLSSTRQEDLLARSAIPLRVRSSARGRITLRTSLQDGTGGAVALGKTRTAKLAAKRWYDLTVPVSPAGWTALTECSKRNLVATAEDSKGRRSSATSRLRLGPLACGRFFSGHTFWNSSITDASVDPDSAAVTGQLVRQVEQGLKSDTAKPTINTTISAPPIVVVGANQPTVSVHLDRPQSYAPELAKAFATVPLPPGARPSAGTDSELVVWQPATDTLWEFWLMHRAHDGWHAKWGGRLRHVSSGPGLFTESHEAWGVSATGLPLVGGVITPGELRRGSIDHALGLGIPSVRASVFALPAARTDGDAKCGKAVPEGARFRLDPSLDVDSLGLPRPVAAMARAAQRYGIVVRDRAGAVAFYAQNSNSTGSDPYPALFEGKAPQELVAQFPWQHLQLTKMDLAHAKGAPPPSPLDGLLSGCA
jgi:hypothetical protein